MTVKMNIFRWRRRKDLGSNMNDRFGDPSISAPTQGSWNEMPYLRPERAEFAPLPNKVSHFKNLLRPDVAKSSEIPGSTDDINFPRHPMFDMQARKRSMSVDRMKERNSREGSVSRARQSPRNQTRRRASCESLSFSEEDEEQQIHPGLSNAERDTERPNAPSRTRSQEDYWRPQPKNSRRDSQQSSMHKSPPLSATAVMRRYSSQSESTRTYSSTPSTATFSSRHTSVTTPGLHGFLPSSVPPLLKEEGHAPMFDKDAPPVPPIPLDRTGLVAASSSPPSASRSVFREQHGAGNSNSKRRNAGHVGPQELVPSNDELWGY